jgi:hypothetical protein
LISVLLDLYLISCSEPDQSWVSAVFVQRKKTNAQDDGKFIFEMIPVNRGASLGASFS